jgi:hypothetical protein
MGAKGVLAAASTFVRWKLPVGVYLAFEALEERLTGPTGTGAAIGRVSRPPSSGGMSGRSVSAISDVRRNRGQLGVS